LPDSNPLTVRADLLAEVRSAEAAGQYDIALQHATCLRNLVPDDPNGWFISVGLLRRLGKLDELDSLLATASEEVFYDYGSCRSGLVFRGFVTTGKRRSDELQLMIDHHLEKSKGYHHAIYAIDRLVVMKKRCKRSNY